MLKVRTLFCISLYLLTPYGLTATVPTPNLLRNQDIQKHYQNSLKGEQTIELINAQERFYALFIEQRTATPQGGILILHDVGQTPDWPFLLQQTRQYLPVVGWNSLSIDLPTPARDAIGRLPPNETDTNNGLPSETNEEWEARVLERIATGIKHMNDNGIFNIAVLGYGDGAYWGTRYLAERLSTEEIDGYALILCEAPLNYPELPGFINKLTIPILDLYMNDSNFAHYQAGLRKAAAAKALHPDYLLVHDALRHGMHGTPKIDRSTRRVWGWLRNHAAGYEADLVEKPTF